MAYWRHGLRVLNLQLLELGFCFRAHCNVAIKLFLNRVKRCHGRVILRRVLRIGQIFRLLLLLLSDETIESIALLIIQVRLGSCVVEVVGARAGHHVRELTHFSIRVVGHTEVLSAAKCRKIVHFCLGLALLLCIESFAKLIECRDVCVVHWGKIIGANGVVKPLHTRSVWIHPAGVR